MKAISLWQPWASLVAIGAKRFETRSFATKHRGLLAIHAAKRWTQEQVQTLAENRYAYRALTDAGFEWMVIARKGTNLPLGAIVAVVEVTEILTAEQWVAKHSRRSIALGAGREILPSMTPEYCFGNYDAGRYAWKLDNLHRLPQPIPCNGRQSMWTLEPEIVSQIEQQVSRLKAARRQRQENEYLLFRDGSGPE